ncbi:hypothetical protein GCM10007368_31470 [Isoptericola cucumis]|uniref:Uncharacterized protein n=1 Tax=Isoptericola cucumis TaxID=1776856 RepID=A0ABQ2BBN3_9MICO|nr:hypothetical protein GCM10007368_31470 [Isoptericola cucumis]
MRERTPRDARGHDEQERVDVLAPPVLAARSPTPGVDRDDERGDPGPGRVGQVGRVRAATVAAFTPATIVGDSTDIRAARDLRGRVGDGR